MIIENLRPGFLVLPKSQLVLRPGVSIEVKCLDAELEQAVQQGWLRVVPEEEVNPEVNTASPHNMMRTSPREWEIDYSQAESGIIYIRDKSSGQTLSAEIAERKGVQHFTLKNYGTVKATQFWPTSQALEEFDAIK